MNKLWKIMGNTSLKRLPAIWYSLFLVGLSFHQFSVKHSCGNYFHSTLLKSGFLCG